jgi:excisionase family DNA binding protein
MAASSRGLQAHLRKTTVMKKQVPDVLTLNEVAEYLRIPRSTAYKLAQEGKIPGQKVGRHWRFHRTVVEQWLGHGARQTEQDKR